MSIYVFYHRYSRFDVARKLHRGELENALVVVEEYDLGFICEVLCAAADAEKIASLTKWNRVPTWPLFYRVGTREDRKPVTFVVGGTAESILPDVCNVYARIRKDRW